MSKLLIMVSILTLSASSVCADGIDTLIEIGRSQADIQKSYQEETGSYNSVKKAVESGAIKKWQAKSEITRIYGEPVVVIGDFPNKREKWVYKPAASDFLGGGPKINLYFDEKGLLDQVEIEK